MSNAENAIIVLPEIYGINDYIKQFCEKYRENGFAVFCPNLTDRHAPFTYEEQEAAYHAFMQKGFDEAFIQVKKLSDRIRPLYKKVIVVGFSIGATLAWRLSETGLVDAVIAYYGSRIRDYLNIQPRCQSLVIFAEQEPSFRPHSILSVLEGKPYVTVAVLPASHGFMDCFSERYDAHSTEKAEELTMELLRRNSLKYDCVH